MPEIDEDIFSETGRSAVELTDMTEALKNDINILNNKLLESKNYESFFDDALTKCVDPGSCNQYAIKLKNQFFKDGPDIDKTPAGIKEAVSNAREIIKNDIAKKNTDINNSKREVQKKNIDYTKNSLNDGSIEIKNLDGNGVFDGGTIGYNPEGDPTTSAANTHKNNMENIANDYKNETDKQSWFKKTYESLKDYYKNNRGKAAAAAFFIAAEIGAGIGTSWGKNKLTPKTIATKYTGCYAISKTTTQDIYFLGTCGYNNDNILGGSCTRCCNDPTIPTCSKTCNDGVPTTICNDASGQPTECTCDENTGSCIYSYDITKIPDLVKAGVLNFCSLSGDQFSLSNEVCPTALISCNPSRAGNGGTCSDTDITNAISGSNSYQIDLNKVDEYSYMPICFQPNDIYLISSILSQHIDYDNSISKVNKIFILIMGILSISSLIIFIIWYGILFYKKFKK